MSNFENEACPHTKIEAGQIHNPECFPPPNELVCIQIPKVFDQVALRECVTKHITLIPGSGVINPVYTYEGANNFDIVDVKVISKNDSITRAGFKKVKLAVKVAFTVFYSDGINELSLCEDVTFNLTVNEIYCPNCTTQIGVIHFPKENSSRPETKDEDGLIIKVEAIIDAFNDAVHKHTGILELDIGAFFVVKCECIVQLLMPAYGYCPVPQEQINPAAQTCSTFNDKLRTPFPTKFFPDQKWNPLDKHGNGF